MNETTLRPEINKEMQSAMQGVVPSTLSTCDLNRVPNVTYISQIFYVDPRHVALSFQFMNKTWRNLQENPLATDIITCPNTLSLCKLKLRFIDKQTEGPIFEQMDMQLMAIMSMMKKPVDFTVKAALICQVEAIESLR